MDNISENQNCGDCCTRGPTINASSEKSWLLCCFKTIIGVASSLLLSIISLTLSPILVSQGIAGIRIRHDSTATPTKAPLEETTMLSKIPQIQHNQPNSYQPQFVLHLGPPKTGTSTLQCELAKNAQLLEHFSPYRYVGTWDIIDCEGKAHVSYPSASSSAINDAGNMNKIEKILLSHLQNGKSPIFSQENYSPALVQGKPSAKRLLNQVVKSLKENGFKTKLVASYRRFYEWLPSYYNNHLEIMMNWKIHDFKSFMYRANCLKSFQSYLSHIHECHDEFVLHNTNQHPLQMVQQAAQDILNLTVEIINIFEHNDTEDDASGPTSHLLFRFANKTLENSLDFQRELQTGNGHFSSPLNTLANKKIETGYIQIMVKLFENNMVPELPPKNLLKWLEQNHPIIQNLFSDAFQGNTVSGEFTTSFPETCLDEIHRNQLLELSLLFEKELYPEWSKFHEEEHRNAFQNYVSSGKYCQWDVEKILADEAVVKFIREEAEQGVKQMKMHSRKKVKHTNLPRHLWLEGNYFLLYFCFLCPFQHFYSFLPFT